MTKKQILRHLFFLLLTCPLLSLSGLPASAQEADFGSLKFTFQVMSDTEILATGSVNNQHFEKALSAIETLAPESRAVFITGDVMTRGTEANWAYFSKLVANHPALPKVYSMVGNHDLTDDGTYAQLYANYLKYSGMPGTYYDEWIDGIHFIVLGQEDAGHNKPEYSEEQFQWLEEKLAEDASCEKPIFLFSHYSIRNTSAGTYLGSQIGHSVGSEDKLRFLELLKKYPQVIYFTGHTHFALTDPHMHYNVDIENGHGADILCSGSVSYLADGTWEAVPGAQFCFVEVYERGVVVKGWDIVKEQWIEEARVEIDTASKVPTELAVPSLALSEDVIPPDKDGADLTVTITYEDTHQIEASDGAWVGLVTSGSEGVIGDALRWVMLRDLPKDQEGRFVWHVSDDSLCAKGSKSWAEILKRRGKVYVGLFEDTLYLGHQPTVPGYRSFRYDPYARLAKAVFLIGSEEDLVIPGTGTREDPYRIDTPTRFVTMMDTICAGEHYVGRYFLQTADLDMTDTVYSITDSTEVWFGGIYDGGGHVIRNLSLSANGGAPVEYNGVFPEIRGMVLNVGVEESVIEGVYASGLARKLTDGGMLINSYSRAVVQGTSRGSGLADYMTGKAPLLANCYFAGKASGNAVCGSGYNAINPLLNHVYYEKGSASGVSPFGTAYEAAVTEQEFVDQLNENREAAARAAGLDPDALAVWTRGEDGYPTFVAILENTRDAADQGAQQEDGTAFADGMDGAGESANEMERAEGEETASTEGLSEDTASSTEPEREDGTKSFAPLAWICGGIAAAALVLGAVLFRKKKPV